MIHDIQTFLAMAYPWIKALHITAVITWMAGIFYLPRLFVYHVEGFEKKGVRPGSDMDRLFQRMEKLLLRRIMNPAMVATWGFGLCLVLTPGIVDWGSVWPWSKAFGVLAMTWFQHWAGLRRKDLAEGTNTWTGRQFRMMNELPVLFLVVIVFSVVLKF